ncbi:hypothetical protein PVAR5_1989 [Paecilomyces variotii No. 5]|uniref:Uncharacterized protein n=1 Tax=Byssochlamys spectabilis (strain No. 5 / NBRC 109023) TaxID=1356009 RepID=V5FAI9_BYSSN|nr:hypothetical protein PVAR5_1989 [Paecilomyces variotii No. 5]
MEKVMRGRRKPLPSKEQHRRPATSDRRQLSERMKVTKEKQRGEIEVVLSSPPVKLEMSPSRFRRRLRGMWGLLKPGWPSQACSGVSWLETTASVGSSTTKRGLVNTSADYIRGVACACTLKDSTVSAWFVMAYSRATLTHR